jgi:uncharacterized SAM-binding protein YcdF (DUF218 family)
MKHNDGRGVNASRLPAGKARTADVVRPDAAKPAERRRAGWPWPRIVRYAVLAGSISAGIIVFFGVGSWLVVEDSLEPARAIVVLSGSMPIRAVEAARIYRQGAAPDVWVSHPQGPERALRQMGIAYVGEEFYSQKVLMAQGVPEEAIRILEQQRGNTENELNEVARRLAEEGGGAVIVVTTKAHTRRVRAIWKRVAAAVQRSQPDGAALRIIVRYPAEDPYDGAHWWRHTQDALEVVREVLGLCNTWAGVPVRAAAR